MRVVNLLVSITNINVIWSSSTTHFYYLIGIKSSGSSSTHKEQWVGRWLINMKRCGSSSWLHMKYSGSLGSKIHWNDCGSAAYLFQLIASMSEEIFLCIVHLLLALKTIHAGHKCWHCTGMLEAFGSPIHGHTLPPGPGLLACNSLVGPSSSSNNIGRSYRSSIRSTLALISFSPKWRRGRGSFGPESKMSSVDHFTIAKHETLWVGRQLSNPYVDRNVGRQACYNKINVDHQDDAWWPPVHVLHYEWLFIITHI